MASPFFRYSPARDAYVLRVVGGHGPVLRLERRRGRRRRQYQGVERRNGRVIAGA